MTEETNTPNEESKPYTVTNIKYGEKTVRGRVIGRKKTVVPEEQVMELARLHCTNKEIADFFEVPQTTLTDNFRDILTKGRLETKQRLRSAQLKLALNGDRTLLIWLGKNILGQSESPINTDSAQVLPWNTSTEE